MALSITDQRAKSLMISDFWYPPPPAPHITKLYHLTTKTLKQGYQFHKMCVCVCVYVCMIFKFNVLHNTELKTDLPEGRLQR